MEKVKNYIEMVLLILFLYGLVYIPMSNSYLSGRFYFNFLTLILSMGILFLQELVSFLVSDFIYKEQYNIHIYIYINIYEHIAFLCAM